MVYLFWVFYAVSPESGLERVFEVNLRVRTYLVNMSVLQTHFWNSNAVEKFEKKIDAQQLSNEESEMRKIEYYRRLLNNDANNNVNPESSTLFIIIGGIGILAGKLTCQNLDFFHEKALSRSFPVFRYY